MAPLQPVGPYQPNPVTLVSRVGRDARHRDDSEPPKEEADEHASADTGGGDAPPQAATPNPASPASRPTPDPLDPDAPGHLLDIKA